MPMLSVAAILRRLLALSLQLAMKAAKSSSEAITTSYISFTAATGTSTRGSTGLRRICFLLLEKATQFRRSSAVDKSPVIPVFRAPVDGWSHILRN